MGKFVGAVREKSERDGEMEKLGSMSESKKWSENESKDCVLR